MSYVPKLNDYVKWQSPYTDLEGWVYFVGKEYITIEIGVRDKPDDLVHFHKKTHCLVLCFPEYYHQLTYVKCRDPEDQYKSQPYRYRDP